MKKSVVFGLCLINFCSVLTFASSNQNQFNQPISEQLLNSTFGVYQGHHSGTNNGICTVEVLNVKDVVLIQVSSTQPIRQYVNGKLIEMTGPISTTPMLKADLLGTLKGSFIDEEYGSFSYSSDKSRFRNNINQYLRLQYFKNVLTVIEISYAETNRFQVYGPRVNEYSIQCTNLEKIN